MLFANLVSTSDRVSQTSRRLGKIELLAALLRQLAPEEVEIAVSYLSGAVRQDRVGVGHAALQSAAATPAESATLEIRDVDQAFETLTRVQGTGSKRELLHSLLMRATTDEQRFLSGLLMGEIRQGALEGVMIAAIAKASGVDAERINRAAMMDGEITGVARAVLASGVAGLDAYGIRLFRPVRPMLADTAEDIGGALGELGEAALEYKFDGARVQVHRSGDEVVVYTRQLNDVTAAVPEIVEAVRAMPGSSMILDGEVISLMADGRPQPFQVTMRRFGRRLGVAEMREQLPLTPFWFDLLYLDGASQIDEAQSRRFALLKELSGNVVPHLTTGDPARAEEFLRQSLEQGHEGVMAKATNAAYAAGARGQSWLKVKVARTLELVVLAAEWGHGRRKGWLSNLHLGALDPATGSYAMLGKTFKGLTDEMLAWQTEQLLKLEIARDTWTVFVEPKLVVEIALNEIQVSTRYPSGMALRFARVKRYRPDKSAANADTVVAVRKLAGLSL